MINRALIFWTLIAAGFLASFAEAKTNVVAVSDGDVPGLKNAINKASKKTTIELAANGNYILTTTDNYDRGWNGLPSIGSGRKRAVLTIHGNGAVIQRNTAPGTAPFRIFFVGARSNLTISGLTISNGSAQENYYGGGAIYNYGGTVNLSECTLTANSTYDVGGAILNDGFSVRAFLTVNNCTFGGNSAYHAGAIYNYNGEVTTSNSIFDHNSASGDGGAMMNIAQGGTTVVTVSQCTFSRNSGFYGGAIMNDSSLTGTETLTVNDSTFINNIAGNRGGGIMNYGVSGPATVTVNNCTFAGNSADFYGGGVGNSAGTAQVTNSTLSNNSTGAAGGGLFNEANGSRTATFSVRNCTLSNNSPHTVANYNDGYSSPTFTIGSTILTTGGRGPNTAGVISSEGYNLCDDNGGGYLTATGDQITSDPMLDPNGLANNGGPTQTIALLSGSPAIDAGNDATAPSRDQRGYSRAGHSDIGSFEFGGQP